MLLELRGDWKWHREFMRYVPGWSSTNICHCCKAPSRGALSCLICIYRQNDAVIRHCVCTTYIYAHVMTTPSLILYICVCVCILSNTNTYIYIYIHMSECIFCSAIVCPILASCLFILSFAYIYFLFVHIFKTSTSCCSRFGGLKLSGSRGRNN